VRVYRIFAITTVVVSVFVSSALSSPPSLSTRIAETEVMVWRCQDQRAVPRTKYSVSPWALPKSHAYKVWTLRLWKQRHTACLIALHANDEVLRKLRIGLSGTPMAGTERELEAAGKRWHVSPFFIAAIAGTESSFGAAACSGNPKNAYGLSSCTSGWRVPYFRSWAESYEFMGEFLTSRWPSSRTTYNYNGYAANSQAWGAKCEYWMRTKFGQSNKVSY
jgi:hypothetical protein